MSFFVKVWRCTDGVPPPCSGQHDIGPGEKGRTLISTMERFSAGTGDIVTPNWVVPGHGGGIVSGGGSPEHGLPILPGKQYGLSFVMLESDDGWTSSERMGEVVHMLDTAEHGLDFGTHVGRARGADGGHVGDFIVTYDIRPAFLPDLRPVNLKVRDVPGSTEKLVCMAVQNAGAVDIGTFEMSVQVNGVTLPNARVAAGSLASGGAKDVCVQAALPSSGQRTLAAVADERGLLVEYSETNNVFELAYQATGSSGTPTPGAGATPSALLPDLIVGATGVNGRVPDGKADCKDGPNLVAARVKNAGAVAAHDAIVRLAVDNGAAIERTIDALEAGQERELRFEDVRLTKGEHTLRVLLDPKGTIDEANEHDNARSVTATCQSSM